MNRSGSLNELLQSQARIEKYVFGAHIDKHARKKSGTRKTVWKLSWTTSGCNLFIYLFSRLDFCVASGYKEEIPKRNFLKCPSRFLCASDHNLNPLP